MTIMNNNENKSRMESILETLCSQWERSPNDECLKKQIQSYGESFERQYGHKFVRSYRRKV